MKKMIASACAALLFQGLVVSAATFTWTGDAGDNQWANTLNWVTNNTLAAASPPANGDTVAINNAGGQPARAVVSGIEVPNGGGWLNTVTLAAAPADDAALVIEGGAVFSASGQITAGSNGTGMLEVTNATLKTSSNASISIANNNGSSGAFYVREGGVVDCAYSVNIGAQGNGHFEMNGGKLSTSRHFSLGVSAGGHGVAFINAGVLQIGYDTMVGQSGTGFLTISSTNAAASTRSLYIGNANGARGTVVLDGATLTVSASASCVVGRGEGGTSGTGVLELRDGTVASSSGAGFYVRNAVDSFGMARGWGRVYNFRNIQNNGLVIADGEGVDRELYMNINRNDGYVTCAIPNGPHETNGWHAVNKGMLTLQLRNPNGASSGLGVTTPAFCWGETEANETPGLVNSFRVSFNGAAANGVFSASLLAPDRDDVAANTPLPPSTPLGLWDVSFSQNFDAVDFECRYDHAKLPNGHSARLMRWNPATEAWEKLQTFEPGPRRVKAAALPQQATAKRVGLIGAFAAPSPTLFFIK